ncbi:MAG: DnaJ C-terminal domain-containing protein [bacterium]|nr:DnaJ C-terminal domain-containing protein [bacterium]
MSKNFYDILGVSESASEAEIKKSFRKLAKEYHPDRHHGDKKAEEKFKEISEAYETLSNDKKKAQYDQMLKYGAFAGAGGGQAGMNGQDFSQFFRQGSGRGGGGFQTFGSGGLGGMEDILSQLFGGQGGDIFSGGRSGRGRRQQPQRGGNVTADLSVSFMDSVNGTERLVDVGGKRLKIKIPRGINNGGKIRLKGQGQPSPMGGPSGDLIIKVTVMPDKKFERKGNDIYSSVEVSFRDAILGTKVQVETLTQKISLTLPPGTQPGTKMRLKGQGLAVGKKQGDMFVTINVSIPSTITEEQKKILEGWGE